MTSSPTIGLMLAGAVAKGSFHAGLCCYLASAGIVPRRIIGASSGALAASVFAAGVATGRVGLAARLIEDNWRAHASLWDAVQFSPDDLLHGRGAGTVDKLQAAVLKALTEIVTGPVPADVGTPYPEIEVQVIGTDLAGYVPDDASGIQQATHERAFSFTGTDFQTEAGRERIALATASSAAFPALFAPALVDGRYIADGGVLNDAPVSYLIAPESVDTVIVSCPHASCAVTFNGPPAGAALASDLLEILILQRLYRDLRATERANARLERVSAAMQATGVTCPQAEAVVQAMGLRPVRVLEVRPLEEMAGSSFSGFFSATLREQYIQTGKERARDVLAAL